jgi:hypothetical protein
MSQTPANLDKIKAAAVRREREAEALKANLRRRKANGKQQPPPKQTHPEDPSHD